jgi:ABC-type lipoprotein release transport system permease subunit
LLLTLPYHDCQTPFWDIFQLLLAMMIMVVVVVVMVVVVMVIWQVNMETQMIFISTPHCTLKHHKKSKKQQRRSP